jgi:hypothetical protein
MNCNKFGRNRITKNSNILVCNELKHRDIKQLVESTLRQK